MPAAIEIATVLKSRGADLVAYADLGGLPADVRLGFPRGISVGVALDAKIISGITEGPTREYLDEYERATALLDSLARQGEAFLQGMGFRAKGFAATNEGIDPQTHSTALPHKDGGHAGWGGLDRQMRSAHNRTVRLGPPPDDHPDQRRVADSQPDQRVAL